MVVEKESLNLNFWLRIWRTELVLQNQELSLDPRQAQSAASVKGLGLTMWGKLGDEKWRRKWVVGQPLPEPLLDL